MNANEEAGKNIDEKISQNLEKFEMEKEKKLLNLLAEIIVNITLRDSYEKGD